MADPIRVLLSQTTFNTDGVTTVWNFSFSGGYLDQSHVKAQRRDTATGAVTAITLTPGMFTGPYQLTLSPALAVGQELTIYRATPKEGPLVDFTDRAKLTEVSLDYSAKQAIFCAAEAYDWSLVVAGEVEDISAYQAAIAQGPVASVNGKTGVVHVATSARNAIINGNMQVDARRSGAAVTPTAALTYIIDRWQYGATQPSKISLGQAPAGPPGFFRSLLANVVAAYTPLSTDSFYVQQRIEASRTQEWQWGTPDARPVTLSFWVKATPGVYSGSVRNVPTTRSFAFSFTATSEWSRVVVTIPGDQGGTWDVVSLSAVTLAFNLGSGGSFLTTHSTWQSGTYLGVSGTPSFVALPGASFYISGVQLEMGEAASDFEHLHNAEQLVLCQRYFEVLRCDAVAYGAGGGSVGARTYFKATKRVVPTIVQLANNVSFGQLNVAATTSSYVGITRDGVTHYRTATTTGGAQYSEDLAVDAEF